MFACIYSGVVGDLGPSSFFNGQEVGHLPHSNLNK